MTKFQCRLGCRGQDSPVSHRDAKTGESLDVRVCRGCGLVQQADIPTAQQLREYYSHHYREDYKGSYTPRPKHILRAATAAKGRLQFMNSTLLGLPPSTRPKTMLDIGAGGGEVVCVAKKLGYDAQGIEPNLGYSEFARDSYGVRVDTLHLDQAQDRRADLVTMFHVLEHMPDPDAVFSALFNIVNPGGYLMVEVPNIEQKDASPSNIFFRAHLYYFSKTTLDALASPYFEPVATDEVGNLKMLFRRRESVVSRVMPDESAVQHTLRRLSEKGWLEYLTAGGGLMKPIRRVVQYWREFSVRNLQPHQIIDRVLAAVD